MSPTIVAQRLSLLVVAAIVASGSHAPASAQSGYPSRPVRLISIFPAGGGNDFFCRIVAQKLPASLKQQVLVENRPGANGIIGTEAIARSVPAGYTSALIPSGHAVNASLYRKLPSAS